jgi:hypothetical protein
MVSLEFNCEGCFELHENKIFYPENVDYNVNKAKGIIQFDLKDKTTELVFLKSGPNENEKKMQSYKFYHTNNQIFINGISYKRRLVDNKEVFVPCISSFNEFFNKKNSKLQGWEIPFDFQKCAKITLKNGAQLEIQSKNIAEINSLEIATYGTSKVFYRSRPTIFKNLTINSYNYSTIDLCGILLENITIKALNNSKIDDFFVEKYANLTSRDNANIFGRMTSQGKSVVTQMDNSNILFLNC